MQKLLLTDAYTCFSWLTTYMIVHVHTFEFLLKISDSPGSVWQEIVIYLCAKYLLTASKEHYWRCSLERYMYMCIHSIMYNVMQSFVYTQSCISAVLTCFIVRWGYVILTCSPPPPQLPNVCILTKQILTHPFPYSLSSAWRTLFWRYCSKTVERSMVDHHV